MNALALRTAPRVEENAKEVVMAFFAALGGGRLAAAQQLAAPDLVWFGHRDLDWLGEAVRVFVTDACLAARDPRCLMPDLVEALPPLLRHRALGDIAEGEQVVMVDVTQRGTTSTVGAIVQTRGLVRVVFDPEELRLLLRRLTFAAR